MLYFVVVQCEREPGAKALIHRMFFVGLKPYVDLKSKSEEFFWKLEALQQP
jgi:hypothetical protein